MDLTCPEYGINTFCEETLTSDYGSRDHSENEDNTISSFCTIFSYLGGTGEIHYTAAIVYSYFNILGIDYIF